MSAVFVLMIIGSVYKKNTETLGWPSLLGILNVGSWIVSGTLLQYEYRKRLSEGFLTH